MSGTRSVKRAYDRFRRRMRDLWQIGPRAPQGMVYLPEPSLERFRTHWSDNLTFASLKTLVRSAESGDLATVLQLFADMESKDAHLYGVSSTRRNALTGLDWDIASAADEQEKAVDRVLADEAAAYVREQLSALETFDETLEHLATGIGPNLAVAELVWERGELARILHVPSWRLTVNVNDIDHVRVITKDKPQGVIAVPPKFVVHIPHARAGFPFSMTLCGAQAAIYLIKLLGVADWAKYNEVFGMPKRWARYRPGASKEEKEEALTMLENMGAASYALFSEAIELELKESGQRSQAPYKDLIDWCERKQSIAWLGQHMSTDTSGATGTYAAASVQEQVRRDLLEDDVRREARTVRRQIIWPMVVYGFPGREAPLPNLARHFREIVDRKLEAETMEVAQRAGVRIPRDWAHERLGIPKPDPDEEVLIPSLDAFGEGLQEGT